MKWILPEELLVPGWVVQSEEHLVVEKGGLLPKSGKAVVWSFRHWKHSLYSQLPASI